jgi:hypothetical protein
MRETAEIVPGPLMAQLAACRQTAGIALLREPVVWELSGAPGDLARCAAVPLPWDWWLARSSQGALTLGDRRLGRAIATARAACPDVAIQDRTGAWSALVVAGPLAADVCQAAVGWPFFATDAPEQRVLVVDRPAAQRAFHLALVAARKTGAVAIEPRALAIYRAAGRVAASQPSIRNNDQFDLTGVRAQ